MPLLDHRPDNGGRRSGIDRRTFSYHAHIPERRKRDRRSAKDRRMFQVKVAVDRRRKGDQHRMVLPQDKKKMGLRAGRKAGALTYRWP
jgi:hypothetical protein